MLKIRTVLYPNLLAVSQWPLVRWFSALLYSAVLTVTLVQSSGHPVIGPAAPPGPPPLEREILLTSGHLLGFSLLTLLWWWALHPALISPRALLFAVLISVTLGIVTELAQTLVADRSASWFDLAVNLLATGGSALLIRRVSPDRRKL